MDPSGCQRVPRGPRPRTVLYPELHHAAVPRRSAAGLLKRTWLKTLNASTRTWIGHGPQTTRHTRAADHAEYAEYMDPSGCQRVPRGPRPRTGSFFQRVPRGPRPRTST